MMTQTHTPGPWAYDGERHAIVSLASWDVEPSDDDGEEGVRTSVISTYGAMGGDDCAADAALIAAAPTLLAACQAVLDEFPAADGKRIESVKAICRAAIAASKGA